MKVNKNLNHTTSHVLAAAVIKLFPDVKLGFGPAIEEGFYYDFEFSTPLQESDLKSIEKQMKKIISGGYKMEEVEAIDLKTQPYKQELLNEIKEKDKKDTYYALINPSNGNHLFTDLCAGGHEDSVSKIKHFKLLSIAGAYWRGDSKNKMLTRIYGTSWETKEELDNYLKLIQERKERDHRKIGKEMEIFTFHKLAGQGFPIFLPDGMKIKRSIQNYILGIDEKYGFEEVQTPAFGDIELYKTSGHWAHYKDDMFPPIEFDNESLVMRPMTCPHHLVLYGMSRKSYRDLPIRYSEQSRLYRYEKSGALTGLERVRSMELTEGHVICRPDQVIKEFKHLYKMIEETLKTFNIEIDYVSLSLRDDDKDKYYDNDQMWEKAESDLRVVVKELGLEYQEIKGEAAFYGPKIDIQVKTALGHEITLSTLQLDFLLPEKFDITYIDKDEERKRPVMIHRGLIGTYERFISILLEQTKGNLPFWIAPRQATIIPVSLEHHGAYATKVFGELKKLGFRVFIDKRNERLGKKIREAQTSKTKYQIVIGDEEVKSNTINVRAYGEKKQKIITLKEFVNLIR